ncbi:MAG: MFS transporter, partial [Bacteroidetes bacterium]
TAATLLFLSGCCCLVSPWVFALDSVFLVLGFLLFWGMVVVADSPLFSTLVAQNTAAEIKGTALTIVNCLGFSITIISIQLLNVWRISVDPRFLYVVLALGPVFGLVALYGRKAD